MKTDNNILATQPLNWAIAHFYVRMEARQTNEFRRFVNTFIGAENDLFHNHKSKQEYHYRYPLIQYKTIGEQAALMGISDQGVEALQELMAQPKFRAFCKEWIGDQFAITEQQRESLTLYDSCNQYYQLEKYIALNPANLLVWNANPGLSFRVQLLERCLSAHILKFASAIQWQLPPRSLQVEILNYNWYETNEHSKARFQAFDLSFRSNICLPPHIGLAKSASQGFGICKPSKLTQHQHYLSLYLPRKQGAPIDVATPI